MSLLSIEAMQAIVGSDMARSIILSRLAREARRHHGVDGGRLLLQHLMPCLPESDPVDVDVPDVSFRLGEAEILVWDAAGDLITTMCAAMGDECAFLVVLYKMKATKPMIQGFIDTMQAASHYDIKG